jgi:hypothetical protein
VPHCLGENTVKEEPAIINSMEDETLVSNAEADVVDYSDTGSRVAEYANSDIDHISDTTHAVGSSCAAR